MEEGNFTQPVQPVQSTEPTEPVVPETPVDPVPTAPIEPIMPNDNKKLNNKVLIILGIVVVAVIAIVAIVFAMNSGNKTEETQQNILNSEQETKKKPNKDTVVRDVITGLNDSLDAYLKKEKVSTELEQIYDQVIPIYKSSSKVAIPLEKSYGLKSSADISTSVSDDLVLETKEYLTDNGFKLYKDIELTGEQKQYLNKDTGVLCYVVDGVPFSVACGHIDWVTADNSALIDSLAEAYKAVEGEYPLFIGATKKNIQDSPFEPYQKLQVICQEQQAYSIVLQQPLIGYFSQQLRQLSLVKNMNPMLVRARHSREKNATTKQQKKTAQLPMVLLKTRQKIPPKQRIRNNL